MKIVAQTVLRSVLLLALCAGVACQTPMDKSRSAALYSASKLRTELIQGKPQIDRTINSMNQVMQAQSDSAVRSAVNVFSDDVDELQRRAKDVRVEADAMESEGNEYFRHWDRELTSQGAADRAEGAAARANVAERYKTIQNYMTGLRQKYRELALNLADIRDKMKANPTTATARSLSSTANDVRRQALDVQQHIDVLVAELNKAT